MTCRIFLFTFLKITNQQVVLENSLNSWPKIQLFDGKIKSYFRDENSKKIGRIPTRNIWILLHWQTVFGILVGMHFRFGLHFLLASFLVVTKDSFCQVEQHIAHLFRPPFKSTGGTFYGSVSKHLQPECVVPEKGVL